MKKAIIQCADQGPLESLVVMLRSVGYECHIPDAPLRDALRQLGGLVLSIDDLVKGMGYEKPFDLPTAGPRDMKSADLFVDVKAHQTYSRLVQTWPNLNKRVLWYRINGGRPEHVIRTKQCSTCCGYGHFDDDITCSECDGEGTIITEDCGDEVDPPCPVLTPNQWYSEPVAEFQPMIVERRDVLCPAVYEQAYAMWPPFYRFSDYYDKHGRRGFHVGGYDVPICLIHNLQGWGYGALVNNIRKLGIVCFGRGSPDGLIDHKYIPGILESALAYVHLKSSDAPGYALFEAMAAACPIICTRRLIWRCKMQDLLIPGETCLVFDRETHDGLTAEDVVECTREIKQHLEALADSAENRRIGMNGYKQLKKVMWSDQKAEDVESLRTFMSRNFG